MALLGLFFHFFSSQKSLNFSLIYYKYENSNFVKENQNTLKRGNSVKVVCQPSEKGSSLKVRNRSPLIPKELNKSNGLVKDAS